MDWLLICVSQAQSLKHFPRLSDSTGELQTELARAPVPKPCEGQGGGDSCLSQTGSESHSECWKIFRYLDLGQVPSTSRLCHPYLEGPYGPRAAPESPEAAAGRSPLGSQEASPEEGG